MILWRSQFEEHLKRLKCSFALFLWCFGLSLLGGIEPHKQYIFLHLVDSFIGMRCIFTLGFMKKLDQSMEVC